MLAGLLLAGCFMTAASCGAPRDPGLPFDTFHLYVNSDRPRIVLSCEFFGPDADGARSELEVVWLATDDLTGEPISFMRMVDVGDGPCGCGLDPVRLATTEFADLPPDEITNPALARGLAGGWSSHLLANSGDGPVPLDTINVQVVRDGHKLDAGSGNLMNPLDTPTDLPECEPAPSGAQPAAFNEALRSRFG